MRNNSRRRFCLGDQYCVWFWALTTLGRLSNAQPKAATQCIKETEGSEAAELSEGIAGTASAAAWEICSFQHNHRNLRMWPHVTLPTWSHRLADISEQKNSRDYCRISDVHLGILCYRGHSRRWPALKELQMKKHLQLLVLPQGLLPRNTIWSAKENLLGVCTTRGESGIPDPAA